MTAIMKVLPPEKLEHLIENSDDEKFQALLRMMHDPAFDRYSLRQMLKQCGITFKELQELYMDGQRVQALMELSHELPDIMKDVALDARSYMEGCSRCEGTGLIRSDGIEPRKCHACNGKGELRRIGDKHARDIAFEAAKMIKQTGPMVAIQNNVYGTDDRMETMLKRTRQIVLDPKPDTTIGSSVDET